MDHVVRQNCKVSPLDLSGPKGPPCLRRARLVFGGGQKICWPPLLGVWGGPWPRCPPPPPATASGLLDYSRLPWLLEYNKIILLRSLEVVLQLWVNFGNSIGAGGSTSPGAPDLPGHRFRWVATFPPIIELTYIAFYIPSLHMIHAVLHKLLSMYVIYVQLTSCRPKKVSFYFLKR